MLVLYRHLKGTKVGYDYIFMENSYEIYLDFYIFVVCAEVSVQVFGVSVNTAVNEGERTFNISLRVSKVPGLSPIYLL